MCMAANRLLAAIAAHLEQQAQRGGEESEAFEVAAQLVSESLGAHVERPVRSLLEVFIAGEAALAAGAGPPVVAPPPAAGDALPPANEESFNRKLVPFMQNLQQRGFFEGAEEGSAEYTQRYEHARAGFRARFGNRLHAARVPLQSRATSDAAASSDTATSGADASESGSNAAGAGTSGAETATAQQLLAAAQSKLDAEDWSGFIGMATSAMEQVDLPCEPLVELLLLRCSAHLRLKNFDDAISDAETVLALAPDGPSAGSAQLRLSMAREGLTRPDD
eukprot:Transcript_13991.p1 GENE.Transcript_13991~~Transcript_13991.p1  ORF type:complete len:293 (-),score=87.74 Transcript_13991:351-1184(-)